MTAETGYSSWFQFLDPTTIKVDERSERDRLGFAGAYAGLINFYDQNNCANGSWRGFLLKDPLILLATISRIDYSAIHASYLRISKMLDSYDEDRKRSTIDRLANQAQSDEQNAGQLLQSLFDLMQGMILDIDQWLCYLQKDPLDYPLKAFVDKKVSTNLSQALSQFLTLSSLLKKLFNQWQISDQGFVAGLNKSWQIRGNGGIAIQSQNLPTLAELIAMVAGLYNDIYSFYVLVVDGAKRAFDKQINTTNHYPDTALLIAFTRLLQVEQAQQNQLTGIHLDFYYQDILKLNNAEAVGDQAVLCLTLAEGTDSLTLAQGFEFSAGVDSNNNPIIFAANSATTLNTITIDKAVSVNYQSSADKLLSLNTISPANVIKTDKLGQMQSWPLFGDQLGQSISQGMAIASPLLYLQSGVRTITMTLSFASTVSTDYFADSLFYLSTAKDWLAVIPTVQRPQSADDKQLQLVIVLEATVDPIISFTTNPDGIDSQWPMFKIVLGQQVDLTKPVTLTGLEINTNVNQTKALDCYADSAKVKLSGAFTPFGPVADTGNSFNIGSNEIFAKPLSALTISFAWDNLPDDFSDYYLQYNAYLNIGVQPKKDTFTNSCFKVEFEALQGGQWGPMTAMAVVQTNTEDDSETATSDGSAQDTEDDTAKDEDKKPLRHVLCRIWDWLSGLFSRNTSRSDSAQQDTSDTEDTTAPAETNDAEPLSDPTISLFQTITTNNSAQQLSKSKSINTLEPDSIFAISPDSLSALVAEPELLATSLTLTDTTDDGFIRLQLQQPSEGFGNDIYGKVVAWVAMENALAISKKIVNQASGQDLKGSLYQKIKDALSGGSKSIRASTKKAIEAVEKANVVIGIHTLSSQPNVPFAPKVDTLSVDYTADWGIDFTTGKNTADDSTNSYPVELYFYDTQATYSVYQTNRNENLTAAQTQSGVPLFAGVNADGAVYLALDNVTGGSTLSLYFDVAPSTTITQTDWYDIEFYYLDSQGWQLLTVLSDDTDSFGYSGIVAVQLPDTIVTDSPLMPSGFCWLAIRASLTSAGQAADAQVMDIAGIVYLNTQAVVVTRTDVSELSAGEQPSLAADTITAPEVKTPQISTIVQPFASYGGVALQQDDSFYQNTAQRIRTKDRASANWDYQTMVFNACPNLYFSQCNTDDKSVGVVTVAVVEQYADHTVANAFTPVTSRGDLDTMASYLKSRLSPFAQLEVVNFDHQPLTVSAVLKFSDSATALQQCNEITQQLKIYLSPWISSELEQVTIDQSISSAQISNYLTAVPGVTGVKSLQLIAGSDVNGQPVSGPFTPVAGSIIISGDHQLTPNTEAA